MKARKSSFNEERLKIFLGGKTILVTGAGGSIGSELCFQILKFRPRKIILLGRGENSIYATKQRLLPHADGVELEEVIGDIINYSKLDRVFRQRRPELVFHAAADKHVPLMELNPDEAVLNNIIGTQNVLTAALECRCAEGRLHFFGQGREPLERDGLLQARDRTAGAESEILASRLRRSIRQRHGQPRQRHSALQEANR